MDNKKFDLNNVGKRMPYTTPDGFFDKLEEDVWKDVKNDVQEKDYGKTADKPRAKHKPLTLRLLLSSGIAIAASIALLFVVNMGHDRPDQVTINDVDQAFSQLTTADQAYLLNIYGDDVFINE